MSAPLRPPKPFIERIKIPLILLAYVGVSEWADPFPFYASLPAKLAVLVLVLFIVRELHHARLEVDEEWVSRSAMTGRRLRLRFEGVPRRTRLKLQRALTWLVGVYVFGALLNVLTDRCDSAVQCAVIAPRMAIENIPTFLQFAVFVSLTLFQLAIMFYAMVKVGSFKVVMPGTVGVTFDDVWGQDDAKRKVREQVQLLEDSDAVEAAGGYMPKGLLLYGPPGTGKTYLAKAAANYSSKPLILVPPGGFQATFVGINLLKVWTLFRHIRKLARRYGGCIVFIDEIDSLGSRGGDVDGTSGTSRPSFTEKVLALRGWQGYRSPETPPPTYCEGCVPFASDPGFASDPEQIVITGGGQMGTLEAFLAAMDGMDEPRGLLNRFLVFLGFKPLRPYDYKYLMIGATNRMSALDIALLRAGRFGRKIRIDYPKVEGRLRTYEGYLGKVTHDLSEENVAWAARNHERGTGAEIRDIVNEALLITFRDDREDPGVVHFTDMMNAMLEVKFGESDGPFENETARRNVAIHESGHAVAFHYLTRERADIWVASIEQRGRTGGMVVPTQKREDWLKTREELLAEVQVSLASRVAEQLLIDTTTNGHGGDARHATKRAMDMVGYGHAGTLGVYHDGMGGIAKDVRAETERVLNEALKECQSLLREKTVHLAAVADLLEEHGTVSGDEIHQRLDELDAA